jgi:hypothetical protein
MKDKIRSLIHHPAAGLVTIVAVNTAIVVASVIATRKMEKNDLDVEV